MKVTKEGKVRLEKGEVRIGNFFIKKEREDEYIKVVDLSSCFSLRVATRMPLGVWLLNILEMGEEGRESIKTWIGTMWSVLSVCPDQEFVTDLVHAAERNLGRHPEWYGGRKEPATEKDDAEAIEEMKGMLEFEKDVEKVEDPE